MPEKLRHGLLLAMGLLDDIRSGDVPFTRYEPSGRSDFTSGQRGSAVWFLETDNTPGVVDMMRSQGRTVVKFIQDVVLTGRGVDGAWGTQTRDALRNSAHRFNGSPEVFRSGAIDALALQHALELAEAMRTGENDVTRVRVALPPGTILPVWNRAPADDRVSLTDWHGGITRTAIHGTPRPAPPQDTPADTCWHRPQGSEVLGSGSVPGRDDQIYVIFQASGQHPRYVRLGPGRSENCNVVLEDRAALDSELSDLADRPGEHAGHDHEGGAGGGGTGPSPAPPGTSELTLSEEQPSWLRRNAPWLLAGGGALAIVVGLVATSNSRAPAVPATRPNRGRRARRR